MLRFPVAAVTARAACVELRRLSNVGNITSKQFTCKMQGHLSHSTTRWRLSIGSIQYEQMLSSEEAATAAYADRDAVGEVGGGDDPERIQISSATASWMSEAT